MSHLIVKSRLMAEHTREVRDKAWMQSAACADVPTEVFFPILAAGGNGTNGDREENKAAKAICAVCPVVTECLNYALDARETFGVWGNTTPNERRHILAKRRRNARKASVAA